MWRRNAVARCFKASIVPESDIGNSCAALRMRVGRAPFSTFDSRPSTSFRSVLHHHPAAVFESFAKVLFVLRPTFRILFRVGVEQDVVHRRLVDDGAGGEERRPVNLADGDAGTGPAPTDAAHAPRLGPGADIDGTVVPQKPDLCRLPPSCSEVPCCQAARESCP